MTRRRLVWIVVLGIWAALIFSLLAIAIDGAAQDLPVDAVGRVVSETYLCTRFAVRSIERVSQNFRDGYSRYFETWVASAGHCAAAQELYFVRRGQPRERLWPIGFSTSGRIGWDVFLASYFSAGVQPTLEPAWGIYPQPGDWVMLIGYGKRALMARVSQVRGYEGRGHLEVDGWAQPGNSGGPVLLLGTRRVIGIAVESTCAIPGPACRFGISYRKPPYVASHIDHLKALANWDE